MDRGGEVMWYVREVSGCVNWKGRKQLLQWKACSCSIKNRDNLVCWVGRRRVMSREKQAGRGSGEACTCFGIDVCLLGLGEGGLIHCELNSIGCDTITVKM